MLGVYSTCEIDGWVGIPVDMDPGFIYTEGAVARAHELSRAYE